MSELRIRLYDVHFGDGILITVADEGVEPRHLLIDVGNLLHGKQLAGDDAVFQPVVQDILAELGGRSVDLYVLTHEHLDHAQGLLLAKERFGLEVPVARAWLTASAALDYYDRFPDAEKRQLAMDTFAIAETLAAAEDDDAAENGLGALFLNNDPRSTTQCVAYLRTLGATTQFVSRGAAADVGSATVHALAPEEDTTVYYGRSLALDAGIGSPGVTGVKAAGVLEPPPGVDAGTYADLLARRARSVGGNLLAIDKANNDTSVVLLIEWQGWRLLFPGDAEQKSWWQMHELAVLQPVHVLKVAHHGSWNGTPPDDVLDSILPTVPLDARPRHALVSTHPGGYASVPDQPTLDRIGARATLLSTLDDDTLWVELALDADGTATVRHGPPVA